MSCANTGPFDGGVWKNPTVVDPNIINGEANGLLISNLELVDKVSLDDKAAESMAEELCPYITNCITNSQINADEIAGVFRDCKGAAHVSGAQVPTCEQVSEIVAAAMQPVVAGAAPATSEDTSLPTQIVGGSRDQILGRPVAYLKVGDYLVPAYKPV